MKNFKELLIDIFLQIFCTKIGWVIICIFLAGLSTWFFDYPVEGYILIALMSYPVGLTLVMIVFALIINPIRDRKKSHERGNS